MRFLANMATTIKRILILLLQGLLFMGTYKSQAQTGPQIDYARPQVQSSIREYLKDVDRDSNYLLIPLLSNTPALRTDLRYATVHNFVGQKMYPASTKETYLRKPAADALRRVQAELASRGLGLKVFDAYRPYDVTCRFWELIQDERYVANPAKGSGHNRGLAVDLTIINLIDGVELNMGTGFDHFSDTAHHSFINLAEEVLRNRKLLKSLMEKQGFKALETEWWHYAWPNDKNYPVMNLSFRKLARKSK